MTTEHEVAELRMRLAAAEARAARAEKRLASEEHDHGRTIDQRDALEESINAIGNQLGLSEHDAEWSNLNHPGDRCIEYAARLESERDALRVDVDRLRAASRGPADVSGDTGNTHEHITVGEAVEEAG
jgi:chromosome segregation ATPase